MRLVLVLLAMAIAASALPHTDFPLTNADVDAKDEAAFVDILNTLLWDADQEEMVETGRNAEGEARYAQFRRRGLLHMPMPIFLRDEASMTGNMYRSFTNTCYTWACRLGLKGLASQLRDLIV